MTSQESINTFLGIDKKETMLFNQAEEKNISIIKEIQQGIEAFCEDYILFFNQRSECFNITGSDAIMPIVHLLDHMDYTRHVFEEIEQNLFLVTHSIKVKEMEGWKK